MLSQEETGPILEETREMLKDFEQLREASGLGKLINNSIQLKIKY